MFEAKYSKFLTVLLVGIIAAVIGLGAFLGVNYFKKYKTDTESRDFVSSFTEDIGEVSQNTTSEQGGEGGSLADNMTAISSTEGSKKNGKRKQYKGFDVLGTIEIPKTGVSYPVLAYPPTPKKLETAICAVYPNDVALNTVGNIVLMGHNYRNGQFFSNNKKLVNGDKIYITDENGNKVTYIIYKVFQTDVSDTECYNRDTDGKREITLSTCTDASDNQRILVLAAEE